MSSSIRVALLWNRKRADLNPPLGYPGGPCYLIERILSKNLGAKGEELIQLVEIGMELDDADGRNSHLIYEKHLEKAVLGTQFGWLGLSSHAQYRMDLRGITVTDIKSALIGFQKEFAKEKSRNSPIWRRWDAEINRSDDLHWVDNRLNKLVVGFKVMTNGSKGAGAFIQTVYYQNDPKPPRVKREDCKSWDKWVEQTPKPTQLEKLFEGKTGTLYLKRADLNPPLGYPGGPCQVLERIRDEVPGTNLQDALVDTVEEGIDLSNSDASKVYSVLLEQGVPGSIIQKIHFSGHAQYRMDLRQVTIPEVRASLKNFLKAWQREKSMKSALAKQWESMMTYNEGIRWVDPKMGLSTVFELREGTAYIITAFWSKYSKTPPVDESSCKYDDLLPAERAFRTAILKSGPTPGVQTFVTDKSQDNLPTDIDREKETNLPPGSATPGSGGREIPRVEYNTPDSGSNISERPRTLGVPGAESDYGIAYKEDYNMPTRRTMTAGGCYSPHSWAWVSPAGEFIPVPDHGNWAMARLTPQQKAEIHKSEDVQDLWKRLGFVYPEAVDALLSGKDRETLKVPGLETEPLNFLSPQVAVEAEERNLPTLKKGWWDPRKDRLSAQEEKFLVQMEDLFGEVFTRELSERDSARNLKKKKFWDSSIGELSTMLWSLSKIAFQRDGWLLVSNSNSISWDKFPSQKQFDAFFLEVLRCWKSQKIRPDPQNPKDKFQTSEKDSHEESTYEEALDKFASRKVREAFYEYFLEGPPVGGALWERIQAQYDLESASRDWGEKVPAKNSPQRKFPPKPPTKRIPYRSVRGSEESSPSVERILSLWGDHE